ncbi:AAA family ATPase [Bradyrhizobium sp. Gha]|uniref:AAA family ATPase n=1 Tax=Bradyrhizobium sp. Gha TaxID=1855318 RepID=UPI0008E0DF3D|nr:AAA family ATPase [Bradyrhizobium sp. Gha]SFJ53473.1 AAA ATPase domain-containing protein [Bradyrhizobium sp. Gha]
MKLIEAHVTNFRSAEDSESFSLENITCLVGKNEAGKSAILLALAALNPHPSTPVVFDKERDYPRRHLTAYSQRHKGEEAIAIQTKWKLTDEEIGDVRDVLGDKALKSPVIEISRRYNSKPEWKFEIDNKKAVAHLLNGRDFNPEQLAGLKGADDLSDLAAKIATIPELTEDQTALLKWIKPHASFHALMYSILETYFPKFMYFSNYDRMDGAVRLDFLKTWKSNNEIFKDENSGARLFMEFLEYAGVPLDEILTVGTYETFNAKLQAASNNITDQILEFWTQNPDLSVVVTIDPARPQDKPPLNENIIGRARIYNALHRVDTPFSERSAGFVWFFSFLVKFAQVKDDATPVVLLLDEPGLTLHGKAQGDLLRYFEEKLAPYHQIVYSTHSPFMVAPDKLTAVRVVEDQVELKGTRRVPLGTKVREDILTRDPDTLFPLQGALGYEITQSLFIGKHTLLVEGASDILYLQALSSALKARKRTGLDTRWTMCPAGGIGNVRAFVSLFGGNKLDIAVLADQTKQDTKKIEELRKSEILRAGKVFTIADFTGKAESDIEDLFEIGLFAEIVNEAYTLPAKYQLTGSTLDKADTGTVRLVKKAEAAFKVLPEPLPIFDHFTPSAWLIRNLATLEATTQSVNETLDRAEKLFASVNSAIQAD